MTFSVIIPAYNAEKTLFACLDSVRNQSYSDFEVIIINDGSTDQTEKIIREFVAKDRRFKSFNQNNQGVSAARNLGIDSASGEYIAFLDSDDQYLPIFLQAFRWMIDQYPEHDHYWCNYLSVRKQDTTQKHEMSRLSTEQLQIIDRSRIMTLHEKALDAALWNKVYRRRTIQENRIRMREELSLGEDLLFNYEYLDVCRPEIVVNDQILYLYTKAESGTLNSKYREDLEQIYNLIDDQVLHYLNKWNVAQDQMTMYYNSVFFEQERMLHNTFHSENPLSFLEKLRVNQRILRSNKFKIALKNSNCFIHPLYRIGYRSKCYLTVMILDGLLRVKKKSMGIKQG